MSFRLVLESVTLNGVRLSMQLIYLVIYLVGHPNHGDDDRG